MSPLGAPPASLYGRESGNDAYQCASMIKRLLTAEELAYELAAADAEAVADGAAQAERPRLDQRHRRWLDVGARVRLSPSTNKAVLQARSKGAKFAFGVGTWWLG